MNRVSGTFAPLLSFCSARIKPLSLRYHNYIINSHQIACMIKLRCVIEGITFQNPENGWSVIRAKVKGYDSLVTLVGSMLDVPVGSVLLVSGGWKVDSKYGNQFVVESYEEVMPATIYGIEKYLGRWYMVES